MSRTKKDTPIPCQDLDHMPGVLPSQAGAG